MPSPCLLAMNSEHTLEHGDAGRPRVAVHAHCRLAPLALEHAAALRGLGAQPQRLTVVRVERVRVLVRLRAAQPAVAQVRIGAPHQQEVSQILPVRERRLGSARIPRPRRRLRPHAPDRTGSGWRGCRRSPPGRTRTSSCASVREKPQSRGP